MQWCLLFAGAVNSKQSWVHEQTLCRAEEQRIMSADWLTDCLTDETSEESSHGRQYGLWLPLLLYKAYFYQKIFITKQNVPNNQCSSWKFRCRACWQADYQICLDIYNYNYNFYICKKKSPSSDEHIKKFWYMIVVLIIGYWYISLDNYQLRKASEMN